ncbi:Deoxyguanosinetriphosphate triphosphohydrolase [Planctomycetales bacterium 10988]|nr:Deoxyguanosinetriphosphate triphosphohydrolase [Planctomycetales bacterium 10988]
MSRLREIPEIAGLDQRAGMIRIPPELDVPLTDRVRAIIDSVEFRRLSQIRQLGLVALVYPAACHSRFEHSLGVYRLALLFLKRLSHDERFAQQITPKEGERFILAALLHDLGHWPYCHPLEDLQLAEIPRHEVMARSILAESDLAEVILQQWDLEPNEVVGLLVDPPEDRFSRILASLLSGPIDIDKMDYLSRDSLHAGVPYGKNFDAGRLIGSLCLNQKGDGLAITEKGKTAAELMVFARYVMFSEVYWHHSVRAATAMLQRAVYDLKDRLDFASIFQMTDARFEQYLLDASNKTAAAPLVNGIFGSKRAIYKRVAQFSPFENDPLYRLLARRPYPWLIRCAEVFAERLSKHLQTTIPPLAILFDAPPRKREVEIRIEVCFAKTKESIPLESISPVVRALAKEQFEDYVKRVRLFAHPDFASRLRVMDDLPALLHQAITVTEAEDSETPTRSLS